MPHFLLLELTNLLHSWLFIWKQWIYGYIFLCFFFLGVYSLPAGSLAIDNVSPAAVWTSCSNWMAGQLVSLWGPHASLMLHYRHVPRPLNCVVFHSHQRSVFTQSLCFHLSPLVGLRDLYKGIVLLACAHSEWCALWACIRKAIKHRCYGHICSNSAFLEVVDTRV